MRLRQITGFVVGQLPAVNEEGPPPNYRLVVYCPAQQQPVFVGQSRSPDTKGTIEWSFNGTSEKLSLDCQRSLTVALRLFSQTGKSDWSLVKNCQFYLDNPTPYNSTNTPPPDWAAKYDDDNYCVFSSEPREITDKELAQNLKPSLGFDTLNQLWTLQKVLDDARRAANDLSRQINRQIPGSGLLIERKMTEYRRILSRTHKGIDRTSRRTTTIIKMTADLKSSYNLKSECLLNSRNSFALATEPTTKEKPSFQDPQIRSEQARLARQLLEILPIEPVGNSFHFTIGGLVLPSIFSINQYDPVQVAAALGLVAQMVVALSVYLEVALPYPVYPFGSQSYIIDDISVIKGNRVFPLWTKGALLYRVEYALYLLHKDIEQLMTACDLAVVDLKQTLANLKNLLLVISAGH